MWESDTSDGGGFLNIVFLSSAATCCFCLTFLLSIPPSFYVYISLAVCLRGILDRDKMSRSHEFK